MPASVLLTAFALAGPGASPAPALAIETTRGWRTWWHADRAPTVWDRPDRTVLGAIRWSPAGHGLRSAELRLSGAGTAWRIRVVLVEFDPEVLRMALDYTPDRLNRPDRWSIADAPPDALVALNAGQFTGAGPWGWIVREGTELRAPGSGPLAPAVAADSLGRLQFVPPDSIAAIRARGGIRTAFQSYPAVLVEDGRVPEALQRDGLGIDRTHRDSRLGLCAKGDGRWLVALTRFEGLGGRLSNLPFGLTTPEMAALLGALGCRQAVLLDGGLSGQLRVTGAEGSVHDWPGLRKVPAGLVLAPHDPQPSP